MLNYIYQIRKLIHLSVPILIGQLSQVLMGLVDTLMSGRVSADDMAAVSLGASFWLPCVIFIIGFLMPVTSIISCYFGSRDIERIPYVFWQAFYFGVILSVPFFILIFNADILVNLMHSLDPKMKQLTSTYLTGISFSVPAIAILQAMRSCSEGISYIFPIMIISFIGLLFNIVLNFIFIYGYFGFPALGGAGCGFSTSIVCWIMTFCMTGYLIYDKKISWIEVLKKRYYIDFSYIKKLFFIGFPVALSSFFEVALFSAITITITSFGINVVAGNQISSSFSSIVFMIPVSIGIAASIRTSYYLGLKDFNLSRISSNAAIFLAFFAAILSCCFTILFRENIASMYSSDPMVIKVATDILLIAAIYQVSDSIQVVCSGCLRGYGDTKTCLFVSLFSYWVVAYPLGYVLSMTDIVFSDLGVKGFWYAVVTGLSIACILFYMRLHHLNKSLLTSN